MIVVALLAIAAAIVVLALVISTRFPKETPMSITPEGQNVITRLDAIKAQYTADIAAAAANAVKPVQAELDALKASVATTTTDATDTNVAIAAKLDELAADAAAKAAA